MVANQTDHANLTEIIQQKNLASLNSEEMYICRGCQKEFSTKKGWLEHRKPGHKVADIHRAVTREFLRSTVQNAFQPGGSIVDTSAKGRTLGKRTPTRPQPVR